MAAASISKRQLVKAQVLWGQYARHTLMVTDESSRDARMRWTSALIRREIESFKDLTRREANQVIDALARSLGVHRDRDRAREMGTAGRKRGAPRTHTLASRQDIDRIQDALTRLGWDQQRFQAWLVSPTSPLRARGGVIRTQADANRVWWALKRMLKENNAWNENSPANDL